MIPFLLQSTSHFSPTPVPTSWQEKPEDIVPAPITQDMSDTMHEIQIEQIDRAAASTNGDTEPLAIALKDGMRLWLDKVAFEGVPSSCLFAYTVAHILRYL